LVLTHVPTRADALATMVAALRPGGWLVVEDADPGLQPLAVLDDRLPGAAVANRLRAAFRQLLADGGADLAFGRTLPRLLRAAGLVDVAAEGFFPVTGPVGAALERATIDQVRDRLLAGGATTDEELDRYVGDLEAGHLEVTTAPLISAWGRRPAAADG
jgi:hypothetical protein